MSNLSFVTQTQLEPFESLNELNSYLTKLKEKDITWDSVGVLFDNGPKSTVFLLITKDEVIVALRMALETGKAIDGLKLLSPNLDNIEYRTTDSTLIKENLICLKSLKNFWNEAINQRYFVKESEVEDLISRLESGKLSSGRGIQLNTESINRVLFESFGRCMFEGCGINLRLDEITGTKGSFGYLAHNVASSEQGPRGVIFLSEKLSNDSNNVLLLCDKHHRLIDKIACPDYPADRLSRMRSNHINSANKLLESLSYMPVKAYAVLWPVQRATITGPSSIQINQSLSKFQWRMRNDINYLSNNESILRDLTFDDSLPIICSVIESVAKEILQQSSTENFRAGLFAFGTMPALIGLGAKIGNKNEIYPMLRYRDGGQWTWPLDSPLETDIYDINGLEALSETEEEVILTLIFTEDPPQFARFKKEKRGLKIVEVVAKSLGNASIGHPFDGISFMNDMHKLLLKLRNKHKTQRVYVLPCASNAVCIFFGKAYDNHHPELILCDFDDDTMSPKLKVFNEDEKCKLDCYS